MILCSLIGADDSDTRAYATSALGAILTATRAVDEAMAALYDMTGGTSGRNQKKDDDIVRAISAGGGCGSSVSQLLLSAETSVALNHKDGLGLERQIVRRHEGPLSRLPPCLLCVWDRFDG